jgi:hypothetical protein
MNRAQKKVATEALLRDAIAQIASSGIPLNVVNVVNVAKHASLTPSAIHHVYPHIATEIRKLKGPGPQRQVKATRASLKAAHVTIKGLRATVRQLEKDLAKLATINFMQREQIVRLQALS